MNYSSSEEAAAQYLIDDIERRGGHLSQAAFGDLRTAWASSEGPRGRDITPVLGRSPSSGAIGTAGVSGHFAVSRGLPMRRARNSGTLDSLILWWWAEQGSNLRPRPCKISRADSTANHTE